MSYEAQTWARAQKTGNAARKAVLMCLANWSDADGFVKRIRVDYIIESTDLSRSSIFARLRELETGEAMIRERGKTTHGAVIVSGQLNLAGAYVQPSASDAPSAETETADSDSAQSPAESSGLDSPSPAGWTPPVQRAGLASLYEEKDLEKEREKTLSPAGERERKASESFDTFLRAYPFDAELMNLDEARHEFARLSQRDQAKATRRAWTYRETCRRASREPLDAATWLVERTFLQVEEIAKAQGVDRVFVARGTDAWNAWAATQARTFPTTQQGPGGKTGWWFPSLYPSGSPSATGPPPRETADEDVQF